MNAVRKALSSWCRIQFTYGRVADSDRSFDAAAEEHGDASDDGQVQSTKYDGVMSSFQLFITMVVAVSVFLLPFDLSVRRDRTVSHLLLLAFMVAGLTLMFCTYRFRGTFVSKLRMSRWEAEKSERDNLTVVGIIIFCAVGCLYDFIQLLKAITCRQVWIRCQNKMVAEKVVMIIYHVGRILYVMGQTVFCMVFNRSRFSNKSITRHCLMYLLAVNMIFWFNAVMRESAYAFKLGDVFRKQRLDFAQEACALNGSNNTDKFRHCFSHANSTTHVIYKQISQLVRPFFIEFALLVGECLTHLFLSCGEKAPQFCDDTLEFANCKSDNKDLNQGHVPPQEGRNSLSDDAETNCNFESLPPVSANSPAAEATEETGLLDGSRRSDFKPFAFQLTVSLSVCVNFLLLISVFLPQIEIIVGNSVSRKMISFSYYLVCVHCASMILAVAFGYRYSQNFKSERNVAFSGLDYLLMFTLSGPLAIDVFKLIAAQGVDRTKVFGHDLEFFSAYVTSVVLDIIQTSMQMIFVLYARRVTCDTRRSSNFSKRADRFRGVIVYLTLCNGSLWCLKTFSKNRLGEDLLKANFGGEGSAIINVVFLPLSLFFRFNSCLLFARILLRTSSKRR